MISIKSLVNKIYDKSSNKNHNLIKHRNDRIGKDQLYNLSSQKLRISLKWKPRYTLEEGLKLTEIWIKKHIKKLSETNSNYLHKK